jgi:hypothetical protein
MYFAVEKKKKKVTIKNGSGGGRVMVFNATLSTKLDNILKVLYIHV